MIQLYYNWMIKRCLVCLDDAVHVGTKINSPHYLVKLNKVPLGTASYTLVVSQFEMLHTIYYTLKVMHFV